jgi:hypothetical protein
MTEEWRFDSTGIFRGESLTAGRRAVVNRVIEPGGSSVVYLTFVYEAYDGNERRADQLTVAVDAAFSDGSIVPIRAALAVPPRRTTR